MSANVGNEAAFVRDCRAFNAGEKTVNPYVGNMTCYGIPASRVKPLLTEAGVFHSTYNPNPNLCHACGTKLPPANSGFSFCPKCDL